MVEETDLKRPILPSFANGSHQKTYLKYPFPSHYSNGLLQETNLERPLLSSHTNGSQEEEAPPTALLSRKLARYLKKYKWYYPGEPEMPEGETPPNLDEGWHFFEHFTLGRYLDPSLSNFRLYKPDLYKKVNPGKSGAKTFLYPLFVPEDQLADFGIGVGMYFINLRILVSIFLVAFIINMPLYIYFRSGDYSNFQDGISFFLKGSAICTEQDWKPCPECDKSIWKEFPPTTLRYAEADFDSSLKFIKVSQCSVWFFGGLSSWISCMFMLLAVFLMRKGERKIETELDLAQQTTSDYAIFISNPPGDAYDPEEWKDFMTQVCDTSHLTFCTISVDNEVLVGALTKKRRLINELDIRLPSALKLDENNLEELVAKIPPLPYWKRPFRSSAHSIYKTIRRLERKIDILSKEEYEASGVFIIFETEHSQRTILRKLTVAPLDILRQNKKALPSEYLFRNKYVLDVSEAQEPNAYRWQDLNKSTWTRSLRMFATLVASSILIAGSSFAIAYCQRNYHGTKFGFTAASFLISLFNSITPMIVKYIMKYECHVTQGHYQRSLFLKISIFRWINTVVIVAFITPFTSTLTGDGFMNTIFSVYLYEMFYNPILQLIDISGHYERHFKAPRAQNDRIMKLYFEGQSYSLAERYTDMNKLVFVTCFFGGIFPNCYLYCAISLAVHYWVDKFCLLRKWKQAPAMGTMLTDLSDNFIAISMIVFVLMTTYAWYGFPYDDACLFETNNTTAILQEYLGDYNVSDLNGHTFSVNITSDDNLYQYCDQDFLRGAFQVPNLQDYKNERPWMTQGQSLTVFLFSWTLIIFGLLSVIIAAIRLQDYVKGFFEADYEPVGDAQDDKFNDLQDQPAFIPQVKIHNHNYPRLVCDIGAMDERIDKRFIGWEAPGENYDKRNLMYTIPEIKEKGVDKNKPIFSIVKHWPPPSDQ